MRFENIKITNAEVVLDRVEKQPDGSTLTLGLKNPSRPLPSFNSALQAFSGWALELIGASTWAEDVKVTSIHLSEEAKTQRRGLIVTFTRKIERAKNRTFVGNTPLMHAPVDDQEGTNPGTFPQLVADMIEAVEREATRYWMGEREQVEIAFTAPADASAGANGSAAAVAENDIQRAQTKKNRGKSKTSGTPGEVWNPQSTTPPTDEQLRRLCLAAGRDVPLDAIGRWTSIERNRVQAWATAAVDPSIKPGKRPEEPDVLKKDATPALLEDVANAGDGWTDPTPPPKAADVKPVAVT